MGVQIRKLKIAKGADQLISRAIEGKEGQGRARKGKEVQGSRQEQARASKGKQSQHKNSSKTSITEAGNNNTHQPKSNSK